MKPQVRSSVIQIRLFFKNKHYINMIVAPKWLVDM